MIAFKEYCERMIAPMKKKVFLFLAIVAALALVFVACEEEPVSPTTDPVTETPTNAPTEDGTDAPTDIPTDDATHESTETPTEDVTDPVVPTGKYTVNWVVEGTVIATGYTDDETEEAGKPADPVKEATAQYTYAFTGWEKTTDGTTVTYTAQFSESVAIYTVTFVANGETVKTQEVAYGSAATAPDAPAVEGVWFAGWDGDYTNITSTTTVTAMYKENGQLNHVSNDELRVYSGTTEVGAAFAPGQFESWNRILTVEAGTFEFLYDWGWAAFASESFTYGYIINHGEPVWSDTYTVAIDSEAVAEAIAAFGPDGSRFGGSLSAAALRIGENHIRFAVKLDGGVVATIREYTVILTDPSIAEPDQPNVHEHSYTAIVTAPSCQAGGYTTYICGCGDTYTADETAIRGHEFYAGVCKGCGGALPTYTAWDADKAIVKHQSFDQLYIGTDAAVGNIFTPGQSANWNMIATVSASDSILTYWGWIGIVGDLGQFGYQIDCNQAVFSHSFTVPAGADVVGAAQGAGATAASRMSVAINLEGQTAGAHTVHVLYKDTSGNIVSLGNFKLLILDENGSKATAYYSASDLVAMGATNATVTAADGYAHVMSNGGVGSKDDAKFTFTSDGFSDLIVIKYKTNATSYGSNYDGYFYLNGNKFIGNRKNSDNWFEYYNDGEWHYLILNLRKNKAGGSTPANVDVNNGAALTTVEYVLFDYADNSSGKKTADEFIDIAYVAFY